MNTSTKDLEELYATITLLMSEARITDPNAHLRLLDLVQLTGLAYFDMMESIDSEMESEMMKNVVRIRRAR